MLKVKKIYGLLIAALLLCAAMALGASGVIIRNICLFAVLVYELVGPLMTRIALEKAGEITAKPVPPRAQAKIDSAK